MHCTRPCQQWCKPRSGYPGKELSYFVSHTKAVFLFPLKIRAGGSLAILADLSFCCACSCLPSPTLQGFDRTRLILGIVVMSKLIARMGGKARLSSSPYGLKLPSLSLLLRPGELPAFHTGQIYRMLLLPFTMCQWTLAVTVSQHCFSLLFLNRSRSSSRRTPCHSEARVSASFWVSSSPLQSLSGPEFIPAFEVTEFLGHMYACLLSSLGSFVLSHL